MRALKPCFFLRRRLFGWKVRFIVKCLQIKKLSKKTNRSVDPVYLNNTSFNDLLYSFGSQELPNSSLVWQFFEADYQSEIEF